MTKCRIKNFTVTVQWIHFLQCYFLKIEENSIVIWSSAYSLEEKTLTPKLIFYILLGFGIMPEESFFIAIEEKEDTNTIFTGSYEPLKL